MNITDYQLPYDSRIIHDVHFNSDHIRTLVTHDPQQLAAWISEIEAIHSQSWWRRLIVGLDVEWRPNSIKGQQPNPAAIIQLCVDRSCVIFQVLKYGAVFNTGGIPIELEQFFRNESYAFVGVGISNDVLKLQHDYGVPVGDVETLQCNYGVRVGGEIVDVGKLAAKAYQNDQLRSAGLKELARVILGTDMEKPKWISRSRWDNPWLTPEQVRYACIDAFVSSEIGNRLSFYI